VTPILDEIVISKRRELEALRRTRPIEVLRAEVAKLPFKERVFAKALKKTGSVTVISEVKHRSPSKGVLRENFDPAAIALAYQSAGAAALSVLTDGPFFGGSEEALRVARRASSLPILRKDFTLEEYHVLEARLMGADAILLIAAILSVAEIRRLSELAGSLGLDALVEIHDEAEAEKAEEAGAPLVGINNRDLKTFSVDLKTTERLARRFAGKAVLVSESGIQKHEDLLYLRTLGVDAALVGESLMREDDVAVALRKLLGGPA